MNRMNKAQTQGMNPLLNVKQVAELLGIHERTCWRMASLAEIGQSNFPRPLRIGPKTVRWRQKDMETYISNLAGEDA